MNTKNLRIITENLTCPPHINPEAEIIIVKKGNLKIKYESEIIELHPCEAVIVMPFCLHSFEASKDTDAYVLMFPYSISEDFYLSYKDNTVQKFALDQNLYDFISIRLNTEQKDIYLIKSIYYSLISEYAKITPQKKTASPSHQITNEIIDFIYSHLDETFSLDDISAKLCVNKTTISNIFKNTIGTSIGELTNNIRIEKAKTLLTSSEMSIIQVAYECGFGSVRSFNRAFKAILSCTPTEYKKLYLS